MDFSCSFCQKYKFNLIFENNHCLIIEDQFPVSSGHLLVITKRHVESFFLTTKEEKIALFEGIEQAKLLVEEKLKPDGFNIGINDGAAAGQTINHLHIHVIPRYKGDSQDPRGGIRWIFPDKAPYWKSNE